MPVLAPDGILMVQAATRRQLTHTLQATEEQRAAADRSLAGPVVQNIMVFLIPTRAATAALEAAVVVVPTTWAQAEAVGIQVEAGPA